MKKKLGLVIIEPRHNHPALKFVLDNFSRAFPNHHIILYTSSTGTKTNSFNVETRCLGVENFASMDKYSEYMASEELWLELSLEFEFVLLFQTDSIVINSDIYDVERDFIHWSYIGAISCGKDKTVRNGGVSIRNTLKMLHIVTNNTRLKDEPEDLFFCRCLSKRELAPEFMCNRFCVEEIDRFNFPMFIHKVWVPAVNKYSIQKFIDKYPDVKSLMELQ